MTLGLATHNVLFTISLHSTVQLVEVLQFRNWIQTENKQRAEHSGVYRIAPATTNKREVNEYEEFPEVFHEPFRTREIKR